MYVCLCNGVTEGEVLEAIDAGACSVEEIAECTGAGTRCGSCVHRVAGMLDEAGPAMAAPIAVRLPVLTSTGAPRRMSAA